MPMHNPAHTAEVLKELMGDAEVTAFATRLDVDRTTLARLPSLIPLHFLLYGSKQ